MTDHRGAAPKGAEFSSRRIVVDASVPDTLLPDQYFDRLAPRACDSPEKRLMFAVLLDAVIQLQRRSSPAATEAEIWIRGEDGSGAPFSFHNVCEALGLDPEYLARGLLAWRGAVTPAPRVPVRQLRTSHRRVTPVVRRRRRAATA